MKIHMFRFKAFLLIALVSLSFFSCSEDDEDEKLFLEVHGGTVWKFGEQDDILNVYAQINNLESNPFEIWIYDSLSDCYDYQKITEEGSPEVIENRENKVQIRIGGETGEYAILTLTIAGDILRVEIEYYEDGDLDDDIEFILERTSDDISNLPICDS